MFSTSTVTANATIFEPSLVAQTDEWNDERLPFTDQDWDEDNSFYWHASKKVDMGHRHTVTLEVHLTNWPLVCERPTKTPGPNNGRTKRKLSVETHGTRLTVLQGQLTLYVRNHLVANEDYGQKRKKGTHYTTVTHPFGIRHQFSMARDVRRELGYSPFSAKAPRTLNGCVMGTFGSGSGCAFVVRNAYA
ncbi:Alpha-L-rhamnosidase protein [Anopheles sinensis]|uniref:Alpha-L-rhamnosidase protein n=1 Tax=Anopheles sinensis TaxID=74873 RepID=A0A084WSA8_ANOSI|nr:Alpha-L-rhamnosidase protein [Anopheles sinensis]